MPSATLPMNARRKPVRPCVEIMIRSAAFLCSRFVNGAGAVSGNGRRIDRNAIETNALEETFHLITTSAAGCFDIGRRIVIAAARGHHNRAKISDVDDDNAPTKLLREPNRIR